jgi:hypothetical protein
MYKIYSLFEIRSSPNFVTTADINIDGKLDIIVANYESNSLGIFLNAGNGIFTSEMRYSTDAGPVFVTVVDLNRDGELDILVANNKASNVGILLNIGNDTFITRTIFAYVKPSGLVGADINNDGEIDIIVVGYRKNGGLVVLLNKGNEIFDDYQFYSTGEPNYAGSVSVAVADFNDDNKTDIVTANHIARNVQIFLNTGNGTFAAPISYITINRPYSVIPIDINGDEKLDIIYNVGVLVNTGNGTFINAPASSSSSYIRNDFPVVVADVDNDGKVDMIVLDKDAQNIGVLINTDGSFDTKMIYPLRSSIQLVSVAAADVNGDHKTDIIVANKNMSGVSVFLAYCT